MEVSDALFRKYTTLVYDRAGIHLHEGKRELLLARVGKIIRKRRIPDFEAYYQMVLEDTSGNELTTLLDAISTNLTYFYREEQHYELLKTLLQGEFRSLAGPLRLWSAGCSSGEEPYTLGITLKEHCSGGCQPRILATDLSTKVLATAEEGVYNGDRLKRVPLDQVRKYFTRLPERSVKLYRVNADLRNMILFRQFNLMHPFPFKNKFQMIFCRNVMIYFDRPTQETLVNKFFDVLEPGGFLCIGHSESLNSIKHKFKYVQPATYRKPI